MRLLGHIAAALAAMALWALPHTAPAQAQETQPEPTSADSLKRPRDPAWHWTAWPDLERAIALRPLDGPDDIGEKADIIADRLDTLGGAGEVLQKRLEDWEQRHAGLEVQTESLEDLVAVQRGADVQLQQRLHGLRADLRLAAQRRRLLQTVLTALKQEEARLRTLLETYRDKAEEIKRREGGSP